MLVQGHFRHYGTSPSLPNGTDQGPGSLHIARIKLENFRNFRSIDLDDLPSSLVIVGENGSGKSNLLHALRLVLDPFLPESSRRLVAEDFSDRLDRPFAGNKIRVVVELAGFDEDKKAKAVLGEALVSVSPHRARLTYVYRPIATPKIKRDPRESDYEAVIFGGDNEGQTIGRREWRYISLRVLPALRDAERELQLARSPLRRLINRVSVDEAVLTDVMARVDKAGSKLAKSGDLASVATAITDRLELMVGDLFAVKTSLGVLPAETSQLLRSLRLFINDERTRGIDQASLGTANLLYLTLLLEDIAAQSAAAEIVELILGIEEPEAHLHPHIQRVLFRHLLEQERALVVTTHSAHIASVTPLKSLVILREHGGESQALQTTGLRLDERETRDVERYLDVTRAEMLFARIVILVEGLTELYLIPAFAQSYGLDLDVYGVTVCSVHGTDFGPYVKLLGPDGLGVPTIVVTDGDPDAKGKPRGLVRALKLIPDPHAEEMRDALNAADYDKARALARRHRVLVGERTLEIDLVATGRVAMYKAYCELVKRPVQRERFEKASSAALSQEEARKKLLARIERVGKGRYAQRLVEHVDGVEPPPYIADAIEVVRGLLNDQTEPTTQESGA